MPENKPMTVGDLDDAKLAKLIDARWNSGSAAADVVRKSYERNGIYYDCDSDPERVPDHVRKVSSKSHRVRSNRIFRNAESLVNGLIANPSRPNVIPGRMTPEAADAARLKEKLILQRYEEIDMRGKMRRGLRNLLLARLIVLKPFWNSKANDFDVKVIDPRNIRLPKLATCEADSDFLIEEIPIQISALISKFPDKRGEILVKASVTEEQVLTEDKEVSYREAWINEWVCWSYGGVILGRMRNPYWDWDGIPLTPEEEAEMDSGDPQRIRTMMEKAASYAEDRRTLMRAKEEGAVIDGANLESVSLRSYFLNYFDRPRKPYVFATILNDSDGPVGRTDLISQVIPLQESLDRRKRQIDDNARMINGITKVDSSVMTREEAQKLRYDASGLIYGKGVVSGVGREMGSQLPQFVFEDMQDSRNEIDNIMGVSSAFRGEREGTETKGGRLALIDQSYLNLNEMVQVVDYVHRETYSWFFQLAKMFYTEAHVAKAVGADDAAQVMELTRDDFMDGSEVRIVPGKSLPEDRRFRYERAQADAAAGLLAPKDYMREAGYDDPTQLARNAEEYKLNPAGSVGIAAPQPMPTESVESPNAQAV